MAYSYAYMETADSLKCHDLVTFINVMTSFVWDFFVATLIVMLY